MNLTPREEQVMSLLMAGLSNKIIAVQMGISVKTVQAHLARIYIKIKCTNRTMAMLKYLDKNSGFNEEYPIAKQTDETRLRGGIRQTRRAVRAAG